MKRIYDCEKESLLKYLHKEPYYCTFILGDIDIYGLNGDLVKVFISEKDDYINCVLMNYDTDFVIYSQGKIDSEEVAYKIKELICVDDYCISGKNDTINQLFSNMNGLCQRNTSIATYELDILPDYNNTNFYTRLLTIEDASTLLDLYISIDEFYNKYQNYNLKCMKRSFEGSHIIGVFDSCGTLVGSAATTAENQKCAMIVNVCSRKKYRGQGVAQLAITELLKILKLNKLELISLYYDNPNAGELYHKLGFVDKGVYSTLRKK